MHPDARTNAPDTDYFFLGDGQVSAAIQWSRNREMSPYGLLLMDPGVFSRKESTLLFHPEFGLSRTMLTVTVDGVRYRPQHGDVRVRWESTDPAAPIVTVEWKAGEIGVTELFGIQRIEQEMSQHGEAEEQGFDSFLIRDVRLARPKAPGTSSSRAAIELAFYPNPYLMDSYPVRPEDRNRFIAVGRTSTCLVEAEEEAQLFERFITVHCTLDKNNAISAPAIFSYYVPAESLDPDTLYFPPFTTDLRGLEPENEFVERLLRQFDISRTGLNAAVASSGGFDASIWQYGYEWGQDAAMVASAATYAGEFALAQHVLTRILERLSNHNGQVAESSRFRDGELMELNANGAVLLALRDYVAISGDKYHLEKYWDRIAAIADLPLGEEYVHSSGLIVGRRDLWERLPWMGLKTGFDTATNVFCSEGLIAAARLATMVGDERNAERWHEAGERIRAAMLHDDTFSCIEKGRVIHRRLPDGSVQREMVDEAGYHDMRYAPYVPTEVSDPTPRVCDPDSTAALPILYGVVDPSSDVARRTLDHLHKHLWDTTGIGGYARSPVTSDPDSPGPWAFPTAWIAETELRAGMIDRARETSEWLLRIAGTGGSWFEYYGERESPPFPPVGIIPWGWAQYILLVVRGWMGIEFNTERLRIAPRMTGFEHVLRAGSHVVRIEVNGLAGVTMDGSAAEMKSGGVELTLPLDRDYHVVFGS